MDDTNVMRGWQMDYYEYDDVAKNYDRYISALIDHRRFEHEGYLDFYHKLAKMFGLGGILDVGCGTGELLEHLTNNGFETDGIDISKSMCHATSERMKNSGASPHIYWGDISVARIRRKYSLAIIARGGFCHFYDSSMQRSAFMRINRLLTKGGILAFDSFDPWPQKQALQMSEQARHYVLWVDYVNCDGNYEKIYKKEIYNPYTQHLKMDVLFETYNSAGKVTETRIRTILTRQTYQSEISLLAELCGFAVIGMYCGYNGSFCVQPPTILMDNPRPRPIWILQKL